MAKYFGTTVVDIIRTMPKRFKSGEAKDINIIIGYACQGEGGGKWKVTISRDKIDIQGVSGDLTGCTAEIHAADEHTFIGTTLGKIAAADALVSGKLRVVGDMNILGTILPKIFSGVKRVSNSFRCFFLFLNFKYDLYRRPIVRRISTINPNYKKK